jgi:hypothetical protein
MKKYLAWVQNRPVGFSVFVDFLAIIGIIAMIVAFV